MRKLIPYSSTTIYKGEIQILSELYNTIVSSILSDNGKKNTKEISLLSSKCLKD